MTALLQVSGLRKSFGGVHALAGVSFTLARGELLALIGPNGAGKSTCFNVINGQLAADSGEVLLDGDDLSGRRPREIWRLGVGRTFQMAATYGSMTVVENVQVALLARERQLGGWWAPASEQHRDEAQELLRLVGLHASADAPCATLAYGDLKTLELAVALSSRPQLLLMDEPTAGMAPGERNALMALTRELVRERQIGVLFTEHSMDVVFACADRIVVMARGEVIADAVPEEVRADARVREVYLGGALPGAGR
jgi:branched-chain amino acid transport system ATP-binding protein